MGGDGAGWVGVWWRLCVCTGAQHTHKKERRCWCVVAWGRATILDVSRRARHAQPCTKTRVVDTQCKRNRACTTTKTFATALRCRINVLALANEHTHSRCDTYTHTHTHIYAKNSPERTKKKRTHPHASVRACKHKLRCRWRMINVRTGAMSECAIGRGVRGVWW